LTGLARICRLGNACLPAKTRGQLIAVLQFVAMVENGPGSPKQASDAQESQAICFLSTHGRMDVTSFASFDIQSEEK
jgi:hypothetical protein